MGGFDGRFTETAVVLEHDGDLAAAVDAERRGLATRASVAEALRVAPGQWDARSLAEGTRGGYGFLVLDGLLVRRVGIAERVAAELLGPADLLRPLEHDGEDATLPFAATWRVLQPLLLAVLDRRWSTRMAAHP